MINKDQKQVVFLLSGFGPFLGVENNPTEKLIKSLSDKEKADLGIIVAEVLEVSLEGVDEYISTIEGIVNSHLAGNQQDKDAGNNPHELKQDKEKIVVVVNFGVDNSSKFFMLEQIGYNQKDFWLPDFRGNTCKQQKICNDHELDQPLLTSLSLEQISIKVNKTCQRYLFAVGDDPGRYICNYIYFQSLFKIQSKYSNAHSLFVHCPPFSQIPFELQKDSLFKLLNVIKQHL